MLKLIPVIFLHAKIMLRYFLNIKYYFKSDWMRLYVQLIQYSAHVQPARLQEFSLCIASSALKYQLCVYRARMGAHSSLGRVLGNPAPRDRIGQCYPAGRDAR